jgi:uncharacterized RDD family membrane protein YckC
MQEAGDPMTRPSPFEGPPEDEALRAVRRSSLGPLEALDSPEQVRLELELAGPMSRAFAFSIDYSLILLAMALVFLVVVSGMQQIVAFLSQSDWLREGVEQLGGWLGGSEPDASEAFLRALALTLGIWLVIDLCFTTLYFVAFETFWGGRTPGKHWARIRVVGSGGTGVGWRESLLRNLLRTVDALPAGYLVGALAMIASPRAQRLGDLVAGTLVVRERPRQSVAWSGEERIDPEVEAGFRFTRDELASLGELERRLIRRTLRRVEELSERRSAPILERTVIALCRRMGREEGVPPAEMQRDFLRVLLAASERLL